MHFQKFITLILVNKMGISSAIVATALLLP